MAARSPVVCVFGLGHLGCVTAACLADAGFDVMGLDCSPEAITELRAGRLPFYEPGLDALVRDGLGSGRLRFESDPARVVPDADVVWVTIDTPVDDRDRADVETVVGRIAELFPFIASGAMVLVSSQLPVGTVAALEARSRSELPGRSLEFACSPENLRLGQAIECFERPARIVVGARSPAARPMIEALFAPFGRIEWMSVESAEMTKHALNAFLATSVVFMNEVSAICEAVGADAKEVERGLKGDPRIGEQAYLAPGAAIAGGTLLRDVAFLAQLASHRGAGGAAAGADLFGCVRAANEVHALWPRRRLERALGSVRGRSVAVLGLAYKPGTSVVRRSSAIELCRWLAREGAEVRAHDPAVRALPQDLFNVRLCASVDESVHGTDALIVATPWPEYRALVPGRLLEVMRSPVVIDPFRLLAGAMANEPRVRYMAVGMPE